MSSEVEKTKRTDYLWVIAPDVRVKRLRKEARRGLAPELGLSAQQGNKYVALHRLGIRSSPKLVSPDVMLLLKAFHRPTTFIDAVVRLAEKTAADPYNLLKVMKPAVSHLIRRGIVVRTCEAEAITQVRRQQFVTGQSFRSYNVLRCVQTLSDSEVYLLEQRSSRCRAVLKIVRLGGRGSKDAATRIANEAEVLRYIGGGVAPMLLDEGVDRARRFLIAEWIDGNTIDEVAIALRRMPNDLPELLNLIGRFLTAFTKLDPQGELLHGDIHPGNVLVSSSQEVRIVDFGLSKRIDHYGHVLAESQPKVIYYLSPEEATALLDHVSMVVRTRQTEVYSLGALAWHLLCGSPPVPGTVLRRTALERIREGVLLPFPLRATAPDVGNVLTQALAKCPEERFSCVGDFARAWADATGSVISRRLSFARETASADNSAVTSAQYPSNRSFEEKIDEYIRSVQDLHPSVIPTMQIPPFASLACGIGGIGYALWKIAVARQDPDLLAQADWWISHSLTWREDADAFLAREEGLSESEISRTSVYYGRTGLQFAKALIANSQDAYSARQLAVEEFISLAMEGLPGPIEYLQGVAGCLSGTVTLYETFRDPKLMNLGKLLGARILSQAGDFTQPCGPWQDRGFFGYAHGRAGIYHVLLRAYSSGLLRLPPWFRIGLKKLADVAIEVGGGGLNWPIRTQRHTHRLLSSWCNGSGGFALLWAKAYEVFGDGNYLRMAKSCGIDLISNAERSGNLCCGSAGTMYSLLALHRIDEDGPWREIAGRMLNSSLSGDFFSWKFGLLKGKAGVVCAALSFLKGDDEGFPLVEG